MDFPDPDSPLKARQSPQLHREGSESDTRVQAHKNTAAWFSKRRPSRKKARFAKSSAPAMALPSLSPFGPLLDDVYVFKDMSP